MKQLILILFITSPIYCYSQGDSLANFYREQAEEKLELKDLDSAAVYYQWLGAHYRDSEVQYDSAYEYFMKSLKLREQTNSPDQALSLIYLGTVEGRRQKLENAVSKFAEALAVTSDTLYMNYCHNNMGLFLTELGNSEREGDVDKANMYYDSARRCLDKALRMSRNYQMSDSWINSLQINLGHLESNRENYETAMIYFNKVDSFYTVNGVHGFSDYAKYVSNLNNLGFHSMLNRKSGVALEYYDKAIYYADSLNLYDTYVVILDNKVAFYDSIRPNTDSLKKYLKKVREIDLARLDEDETSRIRELEVQYETEKMQNRNAEQQIQIQKAAQIRLLLIIALLVLLTIGLVAYIYNKRRSIKRENEFVRINSMLKDQEIEAYNSVLEAQETERKRIAAELHDKLGSTLSAAKLYLNHIETDQTLKDHEQEFQKGMDLLDDAVQDVRTISHAMATGVIGQFGLRAALTELRETINGTGAITIKLHVHGLAERLPQQMEVHIYRIIQELVSNALKHSGASEIIIQITQHPDDINILVEDNGSGFDTHASGGGIGLKNMEQRVSILDATINIDSYKGRGTTVSIDVPLANVN